jgi:hypothetical protein
MLFVTHEFDFGLGSAFEEERHTDIYDRLLPYSN